LRRAFETAFPCAAVRRRLRLPNHFDSEHADAGSAGRKKQVYSRLAAGAQRLCRVAVLALSPYSQPFAEKKTLSGLVVPVMYQSGTKDLGVKPTLHRAMGSYDQSPNPKYYVEFENVGHFAWTDVGRASAREGIVGYSLWFLNHYVKDERADPRLTQEAPGVAVFHYASELGKK
jgi:pimeloyl-ACP methyl ester carboxylesterase